MSIQGMSPGKDQGRVWTSEKFCFNSRHKRELFHFAQESRPSLRPTHLHSAFSDFQRRKAAEMLI